MQMRTRRLTLYAATLEHVRTELENPGRLPVLLDAEVSTAWPSGEYDRDAMEFFRARLEEGGAEAEGWYSWYAVREADLDGPRALVGAGGYFGPPHPSGVVEIGFSVLPEWQRRGYASEIAEALVTRAFANPGVKQVIAHTTPSNVASVGVLMRCGFQRVATGARPGTIRFERVTWRQR
jgi:RimJ/RimL family protein N-acetyltransferase